MSFVSIEFALLVLLTMALYYSPLLERMQVSILVLASLVFFGWDQWRLLPLLLIAIGMTYWAMVGAIQGSRIAASLGVAGNLALLGFFKYKFLFLDFPHAVLTGIPVFDFLVLLPLPIGISFFVFHNISLIVDYYKSAGDQPRPGGLQVGLYILFFPQLVSGPISRAASFLPQIKKKHILDVSWVQAAELLSAGLFFKLFVANNLAQITALMAPELNRSIGGGDKLLLLFIYSFQIYADFFGYSTIALGLALLFGYRLPVNFQLPYTSASFSDFWNRWHISLSRWLRIYLYVPLGGNRSGAIRTYVNLMVVMVLGGLWHGAAMSYAVWGLAHGLLLAGERFVSQALVRYLPLSFNIATRCTYGLFVFVCVSFCWLLFRFQDFSDASAYFSSIMSEPLKFGFEGTWYKFAAIYMAPVVIQHIVRIRGFMTNSVLSGMLHGSMLWFAFAERGADTPFIYFRF